MNREVHVRFWEGLGVRFPRATQLAEAHGLPALCLAEVQWWRLCNCLVFPLAHHDRSASA
jgi:hypothetical protein